MIKNSSFGRAKGDIPAVAVRHLETIHGTDWSFQDSSCHCLISLGSSPLHWGWGKGSQCLQTW